MQEFYAEIEDGEDEAGASSEDVAAEIVEKDDQKKAEPPAQESGAGKSDLF